MTIRRQRSSWWLAVILLISTLCLTVLPVHETRATTNPNPNAIWAAWGLAVEFPDQQLRVRFSSYVGDATPQVLDATPLQDITEDCIVHGTLQFDGESAIFDGSTYIECEIPNWSTQVASLAPHLAVARLLTCDCPPTQSPFWVSADLVLDPVTSPNPVFDASEVGFTFSLPSNGTNARTRLTQSSGVFLSPNWTVDTAGKRLLVGRYGQSIPAIADYFDGLQYLADPAWRDYFNTQITGNRMGHWIESPSNNWRTNMAANYSLNTGNATVYIGYDSATGSMLRGKVNKLRIDPGCRGN